MFDNGNPKIACIICKEEVQDGLGQPELRIHIANKHFPGYSPYHQPCCPTRYADPKLAVIPYWCCRKNVPSTENRKALKINGDATVIKPHIEAAIDGLTCHSNKLKHGGPEAEKRLAAKLEELYRIVEGTMPQEDLDVQVPNENDLTSPSVAVQANMETESSRETWNEEISTAAAKLSVKPITEDPATNSPVKEAANKENVEVNQSTKVFVEKEKPEFSETGVPELTAVEGVYTCGICNDYKPLVDSKREPYLHARWHLKQENVGTEPTPRAIKIYEGQHCTLSYRGNMPETATEEPPQGQPAVATVPKTCKFCSKVPESLMDLKTHCFKEHLPVTYYCYNKKKKGQKKEEQIDIKLKFCWKAFESEEQLRAHVIHKHGGIHRMKTVLKKPDDAKEVMEYLRSVCSSVEYLESELEDLKFEKYETESTN